MLLAIGALLATVIIKHRWSIGQYAIIAEFGSISNLTEATKVRLRGFEIGRVKKITFYPEPSRPNVYFEVELAIRNEYRLYQGTKAEIKSAGIVGDKYINLDVSGRSEVPLESGDRISGKDVFDTSILLNKAAVMLDNMARMARNIANADIGGKTGRLADGVQDVSESVGLLAASGDSLFAQIGKMVETLEPRLGDAVLNLQLNLQELRRTIANIDQMVSESDKNIKGSTARIQESLKRLDQLISSIDSMTTENRDEINAVLQNLQEASGAFKNLARNPWKIFTGSGGK